jgi:hypothetical protein
MRRFQSLRFFALAAVLLVAVSACATTGATFQSGVGDALLEHPPYYAGRDVTAGAGRVGHHPVAYQRGATQAPIFEPEGGARTPVERLLADMNMYLDSLGVTVPLRVAVPRGAVPPDVQFGCEVDATGDCLDRGEGALGRGDEPLRLAVGRPSQDWITAAAAAMQRANVPTALVITLEIGDYFTQQRGFSGRKIVELGTGYTASFPWLTSLETPVSVIQLTGALVGSDGKAIRIGAEGMYPKRTRLVVSSIGAQELISDEDVEQLRSARREDLAGQPLVWKVALRNLVGQLVGKPELVVK